WGGGETPPPLPRVWLPPIPPAAFLPYYKYPSDGRDWVRPCSPNSQDPTRRRNKAGLLTFYPYITRTAGACCSIDIRIDRCGRTPELDYFPYPRRKPSRPGRYRCCARY